MKKFLLQCALLCAMMTLLCTAALATASIQTTLADGFDESSVELTALDAEKIRVSLKDVPTDRIIQMFYQTGYLPTESNIVYIDQDSSSAAGVGFQVYPQTLEENTTYYIYVSSNATEGTFQQLTLVGTFVYADGAIIVVYGDVDGRVGVDTGDALAVLNYYVGGRETLGPVEG